VYPDVDWDAVGLAKVALGPGGGGPFGLGTAVARDGDALARTSGVSDGLGEVVLCGVGDFSPVVLFFFFGFGEDSFAAAFFFAFGFGVAAGVSLGVEDASDTSTCVFLAFAFGVGVASDSSAAVFFVFGFGFGEGEGEVALFFLCGDVFGLGVGLGVSPGEFTARAFRIRVGFSSSVCCP
jgi:hypothetical protein